MRDKKLKIRAGFIKRLGKCNCPKDNCPRPNGSACKRRMERMK